MEKTEMNLKQFWAPYQGAVSISFDDGTWNQLEKAVPTLDEFDIKATFYLMPRDELMRDQFSHWQVVARHGHELGNHTLSHWCSNTISGETGGLEDRTLPQIESDILAAQQRLELIAPHQKEWTFAYPCNNTEVGRGFSRQSYVPLVAKHFVAGRIGGEYGFANHPLVVDLAACWGAPTYRMSSFEMIGMVDQLTRDGRWLILVFHHLDGSRITVGHREFRDLLDFLAVNREKIWTAPVISVAKKIAEYQQSLNASDSR
jgi:hypothetical protein